MRGDISVRDFDPTLDAGWARSAVEADFGGPLQARRGALIDVRALPGLVAEAGGRPVALLLYDPGATDGEAELAMLATPVTGAGGGSAVVRALRDRVPDRPIRVVTTNDNIEALRFYQRLGFRIREVRVGAVDDARRRLKPALPLLGRHGIPLRDEIELVLEPG